VGSGLAIFAQIFFFEMWKGFKNGIVFLRGLTPHQGEEITKWYRGIRREEGGGKRKCGEGYGIRD
jgi:hypothetical protein